MRGVFSDCRYALRLLAQTPLTSALAIGALAVAIGFVSSLLSLYVDLRFRAHAGYEDSGQLVTLGLSDGETLTGLPFGSIETMEEELASIEALAGSTAGRLLAPESGGTINVELVSRGYFDGLRPRLHAGRGFEPDDHRLDAELVTVISYRHWQDALGGEDVIGTTIELDLQPTVWLSTRATGQAEIETPQFRVVGILAPEASGFVEESGIWLPMERALPFDISGPPDAVDRFVRDSTVSVLARKAEGASTDAVITEMRARYSDTVGSVSLRSGRVLDAVDGLVTEISVLRESQRQLLVLLAASVLLAFVAAANISLFLMARAPVRRRELGIRMAVGAPLGRLGRQIATEAATLVLIASALGIAVSFWISHFLRGIAFLRLARWNDVALFDWRVLAAIACLLLLLTLLVSLAPVLGLRRFSIDAASRAVRARATTAQRIAGTIQIAIAGALGGAAIAFGWHMSAIFFSDPGFESEQRFVATLDFNSASEMSQGMTAAFEMSYAELARHRERLEAIPGVSAVTFSYPIPGIEYDLPSQMPRLDKPDEYVTYQSGSIDSRYLEVLGLRLRHGRAPTGTDVGGVLVNRAFAQAMWGRDDVVGESTPARAGIFPQPAMQVIGVLEDVSFGHPLAEVPPRLFAVRDRPPSYLTTIATSLTAAELEQELRRVVAEGEVEFRVESVRPLSQLRAELVAPDRARGFLTMGTAGLVVLLAGLGFYGTERYLVAAGRREYAIRASLGAGPRAIGRLVLSRASLFVLPGLLAAALLAFATVGWLRGDYVTREVSPGAVTAAVVVGLVALLIAASLGPALAAMRTQPAPLLREE